MMRFRAFVAFSDTLNGGSPYLMHLTKGEFANMGGRAGRLGLNNDFGRAIEIAVNPLHCEQFRNVYINGKLEELKPCLWDRDMSTPVLQAVAVGGGEDESALNRFMQNTLSWRLHRKDNGSSTDLDEALSKGLKRCLRLELLEWNKGDNLQVSDLGKVVVKTGIMVPSAEALITWLRHYGDEKIGVIEALFAAVITEDGLSERFPVPKRVTFLLEMHARNDPSKSFGSNWYVVGSDEDYDTF